MAWDGLNRRKFPRVIYPCLIKLASTDQARDTFLTHTDNIGIGGVAVTVKKEIKLFTAVNLEIDLLDTKDNIKASGKIVWVVRRKATEEMKPLFYDLGIEFVGLSSKQKEHLKETLERVTKTGAVVLKEAY